MQSFSESVACPEGRRHSCRTSMSPPRALRGCRLAVSLGLDRHAIAPLEVRRLSDKRVNQHTCVVVPPQESEIRARASQEAWAMFGEERGLNPTEFRWNRQELRVPPRCVDSLRGRCCSSVLCRSSGRRAPVRPSAETRWHRVVIICLPIPIAAPGTVTASALHTGIKPCGSMLCVWLPSTGVASSRKGRGDLSAIGVSRTIRSRSFLFHSAHLVSCRSMLEFRHAARAAG